MPDKFVVVNFGGYAKPIEKTWRDFQWEKAHACKDVITGDFPASEQKIAKSLLAEFRVQLERGYK